MNDILKASNYVKLGGLNNKNYKITYNKSPLFLKKYEKTSFSNNSILNTISLAKLSPKVIYNDSKLLLTEFIDDSLVTEDLYKNKIFLENLAIALKKLHELDSSIVFSPFNEIKTNLEILYKENFYIPFNIKPLLMKLDKYEIELSKNLTLGLCHNDLNSSNILYKNNKIIFIDFDYTGVNDIYFDLAAFTWLLNYKSKVDFLTSYFGYYSKEIEEKIDMYLFIVKLLNATWSYVKSLNNTSDYDYKRGGDLVLESIFKG